MAFTIGPMHLHINGHKDLTEKKDLICIDSDIVEVSMNVGSHTAECKVKKGDKVKIGDLLGLRDDRFYVPIYSSCSGEVVEIKKKLATNHQEADCVVIKNDHKDDKKDIGKIDLNSTKEEIIDFMKKIGLLGQGGAGFPSYLKYQTDKCETLIINAVECEPYITSDITNIEENIELFKLGVELMLKASNAKKCCIGIKKTHGEMIAKLNGLFDSKDIEVKALNDVYPMGWERTLVYEVLKKRYDKLPIEVGAIVSNASSAIALAYAATNGYPSYQKIVTVSGDNISNPANIRCRIGTPVKELIEACGGVKNPNSNLVLGGPMMGNSVESDEISITSIVNAVSLFEDSEYEEIACLNCGACLRNCPSSLQPAIVNKALEKGNVEMLKKLEVMDCVECGLCSYTCPSRIHLTEKMRQAKALVRGGK